MKSSEKSPLLLNCSFPSLPEYEAWIGRAASGKTLNHIVTLNAEMVLEAAHNTAFANAVLHAELKIPDGSSILWARKYLRKKTARRVRTPAFAGMAASLFSFLFSKEKTVTGVDSIFTICNALQQRNGSVYLLGGEDADRTKTAKIIQEQYPGLIITALSDTDPITKLKANAGSALLVAYGSPKQTLWIEEHRDALERANIRIAMGVGGAFAMISGRLPRAPQLLRMHHLEWLWRLFLEPKRIKRIWNAVVVFPRFISGYPH